MSLSEIRLLGAELDVGESVRALCPLCGGGHSHEKTLSVTRDDDGILYQCFRASCDAAGRAEGRRLVRTRKKPNKLHPYEGALHHMTPDWDTYLRTMVGFDEEHIARAKPRITDDGRVAYPIIGPLGTRRGWVLRSYDGKQPKALTRMDVEEPHTSWYTQSNWSRATEAWLVEDIPSAIRASRYVDCIALCGNGAGDIAIAEITAHYRRVVWALDADATVEALRWHRKWCLYFEHSRVEVLEQDLKDTEEEELKCLLS